jgi:hypothetical protein
MSNGRVLLAVASAEAAAPISRRQNRFASSMEVVP